MGCCSTELPACSLQVLSCRHKEEHRLCTGAQQSPAQMGNPPPVCTPGPRVQLSFCMMCKLVKIISSSQGLLGKRKWLDRNLLIRSNYTHLVSPNHTVLTTTPSQNKPTVILQQQQESHWILKYIVLLLWRDKWLLKHTPEKHYPDGHVLQLQECFSAPGQDLEHFYNCFLSILNVLSTTRTSTKRSPDWNINY